MAKDAFWQGHRISQEPTKKPGLVLREKQLDQAEEARAGLKQTQQMNYPADAAVDEQAEVQALDSRVQRSKNALARQQQVAKKKP